MMVLPFLLLGLVAAQPTVQPPATRILFIGNSYTYVNNLPELLADLGRRAKPSRTITTDWVVAPGASLEQLWDDGRAVSKIRERRWDFVVLQEQSMLGGAVVNGKMTVAEPANLWKYGRLFDHEIKQAGARTVLYQTWAPRTNPEWQIKIDAGYVPLARELGALRAPVGPAWARVIRERPGLDLYFSDGRHPGPAGSYLAACTLWATMFQQSPEGLPASASGHNADMGGQLAKEIGPLVTLRSDEARFLQRVAWEVSKTSRSTLGLSLLGVARSP